mmetsp:Transcript_29795/g.62666  ORF Transcript_29795/g.62666 Transcript_29795/m.62666 type:complete len:289 (-) Transcript_29795:2064-2930(-)
MMLHKLHLSRRIQHALTGLILLLISHLIPPYPHGFILLSIGTLAFYRIHQLRLHDDTWDDWYLEKFGGLLRRHEIGEWEYLNFKDETSRPLMECSKTKKSNDIGCIQGSIPGKQRKKRISPPALPGAFYFLLGVTITTFLFSTNLNAARTALLVLSVADPMAGIFGVAMGNIRLFGCACNCSWRRIIQAAGKLVQATESSDKDAFDEGATVAGSLACALAAILCTFVYIPSSGTSALSIPSRICVGIGCAIVEAISGRCISLIGCKFKVVDDNLLIPLVVSWMIDLLT